MFEVKVPDRLNSLAKGKKRLLGENMCHVKVKQRLKVVGNEN
jgi:hypothetical protein